MSVGAQGKPYSCLYHYRLCAQKRCSSCFVYHCSCRKIPPHELQFPQLWECELPGKPYSCLYHYRCVLRSLAAPAIVYSVSAARSLPHELPLQEPQLCCGSQVLPGQAVCIITASAQNSLELLLRYHCSVPQDPSAMSCQFPQEAAATIRHPRTAIRALTPRAIITGITATAAIAAHYSFRWIHHAKRSPKNSLTWWRLNKKKNPSYSYSSSDSKSRYYRYNCNRPSNRCHSIRYRY